MTKLRFYSVMFWCVLALFLASALGAVLLERRVSRLETLMYLQWQVDKDIIRHMGEARPDTSAVPEGREPSSFPAMPGTLDPWQTVEARS